MAVCLSIPGGAYIRHAIYVGSMNPLFKAMCGFAGCFDQHGGARSPEQADRDNPGRCRLLTVAKRNEPTD